MGASFPFVRCTATVLLWLMHVVYRRRSCCRLRLVAWLAVLRGLCVSVHVFHLHKVSYFRYGADAVCVYDVRVCIRCFFDDNRIKWNDIPVFKFVFVCACVLNHMVAVYLWDAMLSEKSVCVCAFVVSALFAGFTTKLIKITAKCNKTFALRLSVVNKCF